MKNTKKAVCLYRWKRLTDDGLLKEPDPVGPYYNEDNLNPYNGFETEEEAVQAYIALKEAHNWGVPYELVLIKVHQLVDIEEF